MSKPVVHALPPVSSFYFTKTESAKDIGLSFLIELIGTSILLLVIFLNCYGFAYRTKLAIGKKTAYTFGPLITGITLIGLVYLSVFIYSKTCNSDGLGGISAGHMFPLITLPAMFGRMGVLNVSIIKGFVLLLAQFAAVVVVIFGTSKLLRFPDCTYTLPSCLK